MPDAHCCCPAWRAASVSCAPSQISRSRIAAQLPAISATDLASVVAGPQPRPSPRRLPAQPQRAAFTPPVGQTPPSPLSSAPPFLPQPSPLSPIGSPPHLRLDCECLDHPQDLIQNSSETFIFAESDSSPSPRSCLRVRPFQARSSHSMFVLFCYINAV